MKIERVILRRLRMDLVRPFTTSLGTERDREFIVVEIQNDAGISGWAESVTCADPYYNEETVKTNWHIMEEFLIPILQREQLEHPDDVSRLFSHIRRNNMAKAALEGAIWDLYAKENKMSLASALGGVKKEIEVGVSIGIQDSTDDLLGKVEQGLSDGYRRIKIKIKPGWDVEVVRSVRKEFPSIPLMVDANSAYTLKDIDHLARLDEFSLMMIEQPLAHDDVIDHATLQARMQTPICLDESIHSLEDARKAIQLGSAKIINMKIGRVGGLTEAKKIHDLCESHGVPMWCGGMLESGIGRAHNIAITSLSNFTLPGDTAASSNYWFADIITPEVTVNKGIIRVPEDVGIGYHPDLKKMKTVTLEEKEFTFDRTFQI
ncbi:o-succinylbenzoate synthase [Brevibacillus invocatus]|uniref:o-succinylbenzoate synthase n=1 Tax=Brevibacillus invocatus TaxID=173959 RepID=A0A3M8BXD3_9BACL|nr:o-succinylbenzoate synthase [Brevibacillus invocatus]RNB68009.1 o-succinylbenzoate synthase [Brevibacillus invocatus]